MARPTYREAVSRMAWTSLVLLGAGAALAGAHAWPARDARALAILLPVALILAAWFVAYSLVFALRRIVSAPVTDE